MTVAPSCRESGIDSRTEPVRTGSALDRQDVMAPGIRRHAARSDPMVPSTALVPHWLRRYLGRAATTANVDELLENGRMAKRKRKLTAAEKAEKKRRREEYMTIFVRGKQKRVRRPPMIDGMTPEEFIRANADPIWLHQNEMWEEMPEF